MANTDLQLYTSTDIENARTKGQVVGWVQGAGTLFVLGLRVPPPLPPVDA